MRGRPRGPIARRRARTHQRRRVPPALAGLLVGITETLAAQGVALKELGAAVHRLEHPELGHATEESVQQAADDAGARATARALPCPAHGDRHTLCVPCAAPPPRR